MFYETATNDYGLQSRDLGFARRNERHIGAAAAWRERDGEGRT
jgi:hypothetical protein